MTPDEQLRAGVRAETIRLSVGIEHIEDIVEDLEQALSAAVPCARAKPQPSSAVPVAIETPSAEPEVANLRERRLRRGSIRERGKRLKIGLVNNMPDAAWSATGTPVRRVSLEEAADDFDVRLSLWTLGDAR